MQEEQVDIVEQKIQPYIWSEHKEHPLDEAFTKYPVWQLLQTAELSQDKQPGKFDEHVVQEPPFKWYPLWHKVQVLESEHT